MNIAKDLWRRRTRLGIPRSVLAEKLSVTETTLFRREKGVSIPDAANLVVWKRALRLMEEAEKRNGRS